jgi:NAD(P) transhydrogenase subunit beta
LAFMDTLIRIAYLVAAALFILGLKRLSSPATARRGNLMAASGMLLAVVATLVSREIVSYPLIVLGLVVGSLIGAIMARRVEMTAMPEMVAVFNGFGGGASAVVAGAEVARAALFGSTLPTPTVVTVALSTIIGTVTFSGSFVAFGKLSGRVTGRPIEFPGMQVLSSLLLLGAVGAGGYMVAVAPGFTGDPMPFVWALLLVAGLSFILGVLVVIPIGGADMPVVVALLNSYSGLAAAATGFVLSNYALIIGGTLVGASGLILTVIMCEAMNRSLANVLFGAFGGGGAEVAAGAETGPGGMSAKETTPEDVAIMTAYAQTVIIVPGYGMAVAQAQHQTREMVDLLEERSVEVKYAIHPVAGRMPGHMNVLLAEADVPYDQLFDLDEINNQFSQADVVLVIGANDVVNPAARDDPGSPIYGMPILNVDEADQVVVMKRSLSPGFAGVENELFYKDNTSMLFGDAKDSVGKLIKELETLE